MHNAFYVVLPKRYISKEDWSARNISQKESGSFEHIPWRGWRASNISQKRLERFKYSSLMTNPCEQKWEIWPSTSTGTMVFCWSCKQSERERQNKQPTAFSVLIRFWSTHQNWFSSRNSRENSSSLYGTTRLGQLYQITTHKSCIVTQYKYKQQLTRQKTCPRQILSPICAKSTFLAQCTTIWCSDSLTLFLSNHQRLHHKFLFSCRRGRNSEEGKECFEKTNDGDVEWIGVGWALLHCEVSA